MKERLRLLAALVILFLVAGCVGNMSMSSPDGWRTSNPTAQRMYGKLLAQVLETMEREGLAVHSILVIRNGPIVTERYYSPYEQTTKHDLHSTAKNVVSALVGIAMDEGFIGGVEDPVLSYFPDYGSDGDPRN